MYVCMYVCISKGLSALKAFGEVSEADAKGIIKLFDKVRMYVCMYVCMYVMCVSSAYIYVCMSYLVRTATTKFRSTSS